LAWGLTLLLALMAAGAFILATLAGDYGWGVRVGGAAWVGFLSSIVLSPIVASFVHKRGR